VRVFRREGLRGAIRERKARIAAQWARFPSLQRFLADVYPEEWLAIQGCSRTP
jgi:hypothetical protein